MENNLSKIKFLTSFILLISFIFIIRLFWLQVISEKYGVQSRKNIVKEQIIFPSRGSIYDRNGKILVNNKSIFNLNFTFEKCKSFDTVEMANILNIPESTLIANINKAVSISKFNQGQIFENISLEQYSLLNEILTSNHGFSFEKKILRNYHFSGAPHVIGHVGYISQEMLDNDSSFYKNDIVGKSGIESIYDNILKGKLGKKFYLSDAYNRYLGPYENEKNDEPSTPGNDIYLSIDIEAQEYAEKLLGNRIGSVVAIEPETGEVLVLASSPTFELDKFNITSSKDTINKIMFDSLKPLFNRAVMSGVIPPGSTFKIPNLIISMKYNSFNENYRINCHGGYVAKNIRVGCHKHINPIYARNSIAISCNSFYCQIFKSYINNPIFKNPSEAIDLWKNELTAMGFGTKIGLDFFGENSGYIKGADYFDNKYKYRWNSGTIISLAIGQGEIGITPLQLANFTALIANKGFYITPHLLKKVTNQPNYLEDKIKKNIYKIDPEIMSLIMNGMKDVVHSDYGTAKFIKIKDMEIAGKTGTAQNPFGLDHSIFIGFAPFDSPKIAIAVYIENAGWGASLAAPIASLVMEKYLKRVVNRKYIENHVLNYIPKKTDNNAE